MEIWVTKVAAPRRTVDLNTVRSGTKLFFCKAEASGLQEINGAKHKRCNLADSGSPCRAGNAPFEAEDEKRVKNYISDCAGEHGKHGEGRASVCADHAVHNAEQKIEREKKRRRWQNIQPP